MTCVFQTTLSLAMKVKRIGCPMICSGGWMIPMSAVGNAGANPNRKIPLDNSEEDRFMYPRLSSHMNLKQRGSGSFSFRNCSPWFNDPCWFCGLSTCVCRVRNCKVRLTTSPPPPHQLSKRLCTHQCTCASFPSETRGDKRR